jgi:hypothetical protein
MAWWFWFLLFYASVIPLAAIFFGYIDERAYDLRGQPREPIGGIWFVACLWLPIMIVAIPMLGRRLYQWRKERRAAKADRDIRIEAAMRVEREERAKSGAFRKTNRKLQLGK